MHGETIRELWIYENDIDSLEPIMIIDLSQEDIEAFLESLTGDVKAVLESRIAIESALHVSG